MQKSISAFLLLFFMSSTHLSAQYQTIFGSGRIEYSGFGGPIFNFTTIGDEFAFMTGGGGGVLLNDRFFLGGYGMGVSNEPQSGINKLNMDYGEGGLWFGYNIQPYKAIHFSTGLLTGWGEFTAGSERAGNRFSDDTFALTPIFEAEANVTRFMRIAVGLNYRFVMGFDPDGFEGLSSSDLNSLGGMLTFKFGWFGRD